MSNLALRRASRFRGDKLNLFFREPFSGCHLKGSYRVDPANLQFRFYFERDFFRTVPCSS